jgi:hypothetical protein
MSVVKKWSRTIISHTDLNRGGIIAGWLAALKYAPRRLFHVSLFQFFRITCEQFRTGPGWSSARCSRAERGNATRSEITVENGDGSATGSSREPLCTTVTRSSEPPPIGDPKSGVWFFFLFLQFSQLMFRSGQYFSKIKYYNRRSSGHGSQRYLRSVLR